mmetsp:Transcript_30484/g.31001  ORF Transcript_30484/g.31001 Transcript_30484/m.31001 type:complete len:104 (+) Transcript_30484:282-593(+)
MGVVPDVFLTDTDFDFDDTVLEAFNLLDTLVEEEEEEEEEEELFRDALSSVSNEHTIGLSGRRKQLYQQARKDVKEQERLKGAMSSRDKNTIVVQSDGTFKTS